MAKLINISEVKKSSNSDIISTIKKLTSILLDRYLNDPNFDIDQVFQSLLGDPCFNNPGDIKEPFIINESIIAVPSLLPQRGSDGAPRNGSKSTVCMIQLPMQKPYHGYVEGTETFIENRIIELRGGRSITLHKVVPGMIVSFHHFTQKEGYRERSRIDVVKLDYSSQGELYAEKLPESEALFKIPRMDSGVGSVDF